MASPATTHIINFIRGRIVLNPKVPNVVAIRQNTPIGAIFMMIPVIVIMISFNSLKKLLTVGVLLFNLTMINPIIAPKIMIGNMSPLAKAFKGFSGIMLKIVSGTVPLRVIFEV